LLKVTPAEFLDAQQRVLSCIRQSGISASYDTDEYGQTNLTFPEGLSGAQEVAEVACERSWMGSIQELYNETTFNPHKEDWNGLIAACLVRKGLAPSGFGAQDYRELTEKAGTQVDSSTTTPGPNGITSVTMAPKPAATLPGGATMADPEAIRCEINPSA
jgi:hypothetical protein